MKNKSVGKLLNRVHDLVRTGTAKSDVVGTFFPLFFTNKVSQTSVEGGEVLEVHEDYDRIICKHIAHTVPWNQMVSLGELRAC